MKAARSGASSRVRASRCSTAVALGAKTRAIRSWSISPITPAWKTRARVDDTGQRVGVRYGGEQRGDRVPVGDVARDHRHLSALLPSSATSRAASLGLRTAATGQDEVPYAVPLDQMPGDRGTEHAGAAGDEHRAVRIQHRFGGGRPGRPGRARHTTGAAPRTATCGSPLASTAPRSTSSVSPSTSTIRSGFSACARTDQPQTAAPPGSGDHLRHHPPAPHPGSPPPAGRPRHPPPPAKTARPPAPDPPTPPGASPAERCLDHRHLRHLTGTSNR